MQRLQADGRQPINLTDVPRECEAFEVGHVQVSELWRGISLE
jgi:hypothetical protein